MSGCNCGIHYIGKVLGYRAPFYKTVSNRPNDCVDFFLKERNIDPLHHRGYSLEYFQAQPNAVSHFSAFNKFRRPSSPSFSGSVLAVAYDWMFKHFSPFVLGSRVLGLISVFLQMNKGTTNGFPLRDSEFLTKAMFFNWPAIFKYMTEYEVQFALRQIVPIFQFCDKREIIKFSKFFSNPMNVRGFLAAPTDFCLLSNIYCQDFNEKITSAYDNSFVGFGITKFRGGWHKLFSQLSKFPRGFSLDCKNYDTSVFSKLFYYISVFRYEVLSSEFKTPHAKNVISWMYECIPNSIVILNDGTLHQMFIGNKSGQANTLVDNSLINSMLLFYSYIMLAKIYSAPLDYSFFMQNVFAKFCGDDNTMSVSEEILGWFNCFNCTLIYRSLGFVLTCDEEEPKLIQDLDYLSHTFYFDKIWLPIPKLNKVWSSFILGSSDNDPRWNFLRVSALRIECWPVKDLVLIFEDFLYYLRQNYANRLSGSVYIASGVPVVTWDSIEATYLSSETLDRLYYGYEGQLGLINEPPNKIFETLRLLEIYDL